MDPDVTRVFRLVGWMVLISAVVGYVVVHTAHTGIPTLGPRLLGIFAALVLFHAGPLTLDRRNGPASLADLELLV